MEKYLLSDLVNIKDRTGQPLSSQICTLQAKAARHYFKQFLQQKLLPFLTNQLRNSVPVKLFISCAWATEDSETYLQDKAYESYTKRFVKDLERAGCEPIFQCTNAKKGFTSAYFLEQMEHADYLLPIGTDLYHKNYKQKDELIKQASDTLGAEGQILNYFAMYSDLWKTKIIPILLQGTSETSLPFILRPIIPFTFVESDYFETFFALIKLIYKVNPRDKAWDKLSQEFFGVLSALKEQITPDHEAENNNQHQERLKGKRETWHQTASSVLLHI